MIVVVVVVVVVVCVVDVGVGVGVVDGVWVVDCVMGGGTKPDAQDPVPVVTHVSI